MSVIIKIGIGILNIIYFFIKLLPTQHKVVFISREKNSPSIDFTLVGEALQAADPKLKVVMLCRRLEPGFSNKVKYVLHMFRQMYHIATSKVVVLDTYAICISVLRHKKNLVVIQMWHAMGSFKKFGYSILDKKEGSNSKMAKLMHMHENYDYVFASSESCLENFREAFNVAKEKMVVMPLPRVDLVKDKHNIQNNKNKVLEKYPRINDKEVILYAPTFRKNKDMKKDIQKLIDAVDHDKYNLVIKLHPLSKTVIDDERVIFDRSFTTLEMACVSDYVITDYSAVVFEIALLDKPLFFYAYDMKDYIDSRNFYMNYEKDMPGKIAANPKKIIEAIEKKDYDVERVRDFANQNVALVKGGYTNNVVKFIRKFL